MQKENPYAIVPGVKPRKTIGREEESQRVLDDFTATWPLAMIYTVAGVRGSGKTVFMRKIEERLVDTGAWVSVFVSIREDKDMDILKAIVDELRSNPLTKEDADDEFAIVDAGADNAGENAQPVSDRSYEIALRKTLGKMQAKSQRLLLALDDVSDTKDMRAFAGLFNRMLIKGLPIFTLIAGQYDELAELEDHPGIQFLCRSPYIELGPLDTDAIANDYENTLQVSGEDTAAMAEMTLGYPVAYQALGHYVWMAGGSCRQAAEYLYTHLEIFVYETLWAGMDNKCRAACAAIAANGERLERRQEGLSASLRKLADIGIIGLDEDGYAIFLLPGFGEFAAKKSGVEEQAV